MTTTRPPFLLPPLENPYVQPVVSSTGQSIYFVIENEGEWHCTCPATVACKHLNAVRAARIAREIEDLSRKLA
jgi:hypothetical protein